MIQRRCPDHVVLLCGRVAGIEEGVLDQRKTLTESPLDIICMYGEFKKSAKECHNVSKLEWPELYT